MTKGEWIEKLKRELKLRNYADSTISTYSGCLSVILDKYKHYNGYKDVEDIKSFLLTINNQNYHRSFTATFHHFFEKVIKKPLSLDDIPYPRPTHYLPQILSVQEVNRMFACIQNLKHLCILKLIYVCGLRISEAINVVCRKGLSHIDANRKTLLVKGAKGFKDRYVYIPEETIQLLRSYVMRYKPQYWLFEGQKGDKYSKRSIQQIFARAIAAAKINKRCTPHSLRHSRATHLLESPSGTMDIYKLKEFLGHNNIKTTEIYLHLSKKSLIDSMELADQYINQCFANYTPARKGQPKIFHSNRTVVHPDYQGLGLGIKLINESSRVFHAEFPQHRIMAKFSALPVFKAMIKQKEWRYLDTKRLMGKMHTGGNMDRKGGFREGGVKTYHFEYKG
jgi:integrase/recombinase XerD